MVVPKNPPDGAGAVVVVVEKEKGEVAGGAVLEPNRPPDGAAAEVLLVLVLVLVFRLMPPNGEGVVLGFCDVDGSNIDFRLPWASVVGLRLNPVNGLFGGTVDGGPKSDILSRRMGDAELGQLKWLWTLNSRSRVSEKVAASAFNFNSVAALAAKPYEAGFDWTV